MTHNGTRIHLCTRHPWVPREPFCAVWSPSPPAHAQNLVRGVVSSAVCLTQRLSSGTMCRPWGETLRRRLM
jgi:hypothetical protein